MKKRFISILITVAMLVSLLPVFELPAAAADVWDGTTIATSFAGGSGTESAPYQIATGAQLAYLAKCVDAQNNTSYNTAYFKLTADIDLNNKNWTPIGIVGYPESRVFKGKLDGDGHTISNMKITADSSSVNYDLIGYMDGGTVKNMTINGDITVAVSEPYAHYYTGIAVGSTARDSANEISNITVSGKMTISTTEQVQAGGILGGDGGGSEVTTVSGCKSSVNITRTYGGTDADGTVDGIGGIAGYAIKLSITSCSNTGTISSGGNYVGGITGKSDSTTISTSYNEGNVRGLEYAGGITGSDSGTTQNCYNIGSVTSTTTNGYGTVGGVVGNGPWADVKYCYNYGAVNGSGNWIGGIRGYKGSGSTTNCFYLKTGTVNASISGIQGSDEAGSATPLNTEGFKAQANFTDWDFNDIWSMDASLGRPVLQAFVHKHNWIFTASDNKITATCDKADCDLHGESGTLTISAPITTTYNRNEHKATVTNNFNEAVNATVGSIYYYSKPTSSDSYTSIGSPRSAGYYKATVSVGGATAEVEYIINKAEVTAPSNPASKTYTGGTLKADISADAQHTYRVKTNDGGINAGDYDVVLELENSGNYKWSDSDSPTKKLTFTITKATNEWTTAPSISGWTYNGTASEAAGAAKFGDVSVNYTGTVNGGAAYNSADKPTAAGSYTATFTVAGTNNYTGLSETKDFTIAKATPSYTVPSNLTATYGQTLADVTLPSGWSWNNSSTSVGSVGTNSFPATYTSTDTNNYNTASANLFVSVGKATPTVTEPTSSGSLTYGQKLSGLSLTSGWAWKDGNTIPTVTNSGYDAVKSVTDYDNYDYSNLSGYTYNEIAHTLTRTVAVTVNRATMTNFAVNISGWTYGGAANAPSVENNSGDGTVTYEYKAQAAADTAYSTDVPDSAGDYTVRATVSETANYNSASATKNFIISKASQSASAPTLVSATINSITLNAQSGEGTTEYAKNTENTAPSDGWQTSPTFTGLTQNTEYYFFTRFNGNGNYEAATSTGAKFSTSSHAHNWTLNVSGGEITAVCDGEGTCDLNNDGGKVTLSAPSNLTYDTNAHNATVANTLNALLNVTPSAVTYKYSTSESGSYTDTTDTTKAGWYKASITAGGKTATVTYEVKKAAAPSITVPTLSAVTYSPTQKLSDITLDGGWSWTDDATVPTVPVNKYSAYITVDDSNYDYSEVDGYDNDTHKVTCDASLTVNKANQTISAPTAQTVGSVNVTLDTIAGGVNGVKYAVNTENTAPTDADKWQESPTFTGLTKNTTYYFFAKYNENENYNEAVSAGAAVTTADHTHEWEYTVSGTTITATCKNTDGACTDTDGGSVTLTAPTENLIYNTESLNAAVTNTLSAQTGDTVTVKYEYKAAADGSYAETNTTVNAGFYKASVTLDTDKTISVEYAVAKATPQYTEPTTPQSATYGDTLGSLALPAGFTWDKDNNESVGNVGNNSFNVTFTPNDTVNYNTVQKTITVNVSALPETIIDKDDITIDFRNETIGSFANGTYIITADGISTEIAVTDGTIPIANNYFGEDIAIVKKAEDANHANSSPLAISISARPSKPSGVEVTKATDDDAANGKITGVDDTMEYKAADDEAWTPIDGEEITGLLKGTYYVRVAPTDNAFASEAVTAVIGVMGKVTVVFVDGDGKTLATQIVAPYTIVTYEGNTPTKTATAQFTYEFTDWDKKVGEVTEDTTFTAQFDKHFRIYTVTLHENGGTITGDFDSYTYGIGLKLPIAEQIVKDGYTFIGWYDNAEFEGEAVTEISADTTGNKEYFARWKLNGTTTSEVIDNSGSSAKVEVENLEKIAEELSENIEGDVEVVLEITKENADSESAEQAAIEAIKTTNTVEYYDIALLVNTEKQATTPNAISIKIPYDTTRVNITVYRYDAAATAKAITLSVVDTDNEYYEISDGYITIHTNSFATYAIGYDAPAATDTPRRSGGGSSRAKATPTPSPSAIPEPTTEPEGTPSPEPTETPSDAWWYVDVPEMEWYYEPVKAVTDKGLMTGVWNGENADEFQPDFEISRAMFITVIYRIAGEPKADLDYTFEDILKDWYYEKAVAWGSANGIIAGYDEKTFAPDDKITREQMAAMLWRYAKYKGIDVSIGEDTNILSFNDAENITEYAIPAIQWACGEDIISGYTDNTLRPQANTTRAQAAVVFDKIDDIVK